MYLNHQVNTGAQHVVTAEMVSAARVSAREPLGGVSYAVTWKLVLFLVVEPQSIGLLQCVHCSGYFWGGILGGMGAKEAFAGMQHTLGCPQNAENVGKTRMHGDKRKIRS